MVWCGVACGVAARRGGGGRMASVVAEMDGTGRDGTGRDDGTRGSGG